MSGNILFLIMTITWVLSGFIAWIIYGYISEYENSGLSVLCVVISVILGPIAMISAFIRIFIEIGKYVIGKTIYHVNNIKGD